MRKRFVLLRVALAAIGGAGRFPQHAPQQVAGPAPLVPSLLFGTLPETKITIHPKPSSRKRNCNE